MLLSGSAGGADPVNTKPWLKVAANKKDSFNAGRPNGHSQESNGHYGGRRVSAHDVGLGMVIHCYFLLLLLLFLLLLLLLSKIIILFVVCLVVVVAAAAVVASDVCYNKMIHLLFSQFDRSGVASGLPEPEPDYSGLGDEVNSRQNGRNRNRQGIYLLLSSLS